jgi:hypothetical protein
LWYDRVHHRTIFEMGVIEYATDVPARGREVMWIVPWHKLALQAIGQTFCEDTAADIARFGARSTP